MAPVRTVSKRRNTASATGQSLAQMMEDLRNFRAELEIQNQALQYSQAAAEGASERFLTLFSNVPLALMVVDENSLVLESNAMALSLFRPEEYDPPLNFLFPLVHDEHVGKVTLAFATAKEVGSSQATELLFSRGSSGHFTGDLHVARIENPLDELAHFICAIIDQGPLLAQRRALQLSKDRLASIINASHDAIICVDQTLQITIFNPTAAALFQCPQDSALGSELSRFLPEAFDALAQGRPASHAQLGEMTGLTALGQNVAVEASVSIERHPEGETITIFVKDLTATKREEAHRNALEAQLRESQKMQAVGTMAGGIAHDFNNIISAILGNVELAIQDVGPHAPAHVSLSEIDKAGRRARDLVRQILAFSRNESPKRTPLRLSDVIEESVRLLKVTLPPGVDMQVLMDPETPCVMADPTQIEQALLNLCNNAIQSIGANRGTVSIELRHSQHEAGDLIERREGVRGAHVSLVVRDTGSGMTDDTLKRVFDPFFTTKPVGQGTGLGLSVVHGIMRTHMGTVEVQSILGVGSEFTLNFPPTQELVAPIPAIALKPKAICGIGQRIMYVDDDEALVFLIERALTRRGFKVHTFTDPRAAMSTLRNSPHDYDLVVTDYNMPGFSGVDLLREARQIRPDLPIALASGYVTPEIEASARDAGARALIHKPNDVDEMCETLQRLLTTGDGKP